MATATEVEREFITPRAVAQIIGVRIEMVHYWIREGELPASNLAKRGAKLPRFFVRRSDVDQFMDAKSVIASRPVKAPRKPKLPAARQWV